MAKRPIKVTDEIRVKCDAPNQFARFDDLFRKVIAVPRTAAAKEDLRFKRQRSKAKKTDK